MRPRIQRGAWQTVKEWKDLYDYLDGLSIFLDFRSRSDPYFDVRDYGAVGDGVADDTAAFQAAIDAAYNAGGGFVLLQGPAFYNFTLADLTNKTNVVLVGASDGTIYFDRLP